MPVIDLAMAQAQLAAWLEASAAVARNQEYRIGDRTLRRVDAAEIRNQIDYWEGKVLAASPRRSRTRYVVTQ
ncbi:hypothetical protein SAMN02745157_0690 [Kaistia soli DSM 19436]|uniref:GpW protein n=1 Tax=Kaistia soli DSM 19436 TaxID=1122133 RepID=A0A1M4VF77_9HYPH|nr:DUF6148 family protein [Kaistia soli]SHE67656.1 hypothetical protein SAMN02745157_0690 [Kaistia soli DSM 19436]